MTDKSTHKNKPAFLGEAFNKIAVIFTIFGVSLTTIWGAYLNGKKPYYTTKSSSTCLYKVKNQFASFIPIDKDQCLKQGGRYATRTILLFWNGGKQTIEKNDLKNSNEDKESIKVSVGEIKDNIEILSINKLYSEDNETKIKVNFTEKEISFDFLEMGQGAIIELLHTGNINEHIFLNGYIKDSKFRKGKIKKINSLNDISYIDKSLPIIVLILIAAISWLITRNKRYLLTKLSKNKNLFFLAFIYNLVLAFILPLIVLVSILIQHKSVPRFTGLPQESYEKFISY